MVTNLERLSKISTKIIEKILIVLGLILVFVNFIQIIGRCVFFYSLPWSEELSVWIFVVLIFLSLGLIVKDRSEVSIELISLKKTMPRYFQELIQHFISLFGIAMLFLSTVFLTKNAFQFNQTTPTLEISYALTYSLMAIGFFLALFEKIILIIHTCLKMKEAGGGTEV